MLSPGEQPRTPPLSLHRVFLLLCLCAGIAGLLFSQAGNLREYKQYFTQTRKPASLDITALSEEWTERSLKEHFSGYSVNCYPYQGPLAVQHVCAVEVSSTNGVPTLYMSFFFAGGLLDQVSINVPWWSHQAAYKHLVTSLGSPPASQFLPRNGVRLHGWQLGNGSAVFLNRDRPINPLQWNAIYWRSATGCKHEGCFRE